MTETPRDPHPPQYHPDSGIKADLIGRDSNYVDPAAVAQVSQDYHPRNERPITRGLKAVTMRPIPANLGNKVEAE